MLVTEDGMKSVFKAKQVKQKLKGIEVTDVGIARAVREKA